MVGGSRYDPPGQRCGPECQRLVGPRLVWPEPESWTPESSVRKEPVSLSARSAVTSHCHVSTVLTWSDVPWSTKLIRKNILRIYKVEETTESSLTLSFIPAFHG